VWLKLDTTHISLVAGDYFVETEDYAVSQEHRLEIPAICLKRLDLENFFVERKVKR